MMDPSVADAPLPPPRKSSLRADDNYDEVGVSQGTDYLGKQGSEEETSEVEKQISVDPVSLKESSSSSTVARRSNASSQHFTLPPLATKPKFISCSLPSSAVSTPKAGIKLKKKWRHESHASPTHVDALARQDSAAFSFVGSWRHNHLQKSISGSEGRPSAFDDNIDIIYTKVTASEFNVRHTVSPSGVDAKKATHRDSKKAKHRNAKKNIPTKCCWYLPNFGKAKPVRARKHEDIKHVISRTVSLEKFECGSWVSSGIVNESEHSSTDSKNFFDLPMELIRSGVNDAVSPVRTVFYFDRDTKEILGTASSRRSHESTSRRSHDSKSRKSHESSSSSRHIRGRSSSCPPSPKIISPRLAKARDEFNAFLAAHRG